MVDAYEIGIELALQDGVSAGLEAVAKELVALDAAVAASSAGLMALVRTAGLAAEAVAAVGGVRVRLPAVEPVAARPAVSDEAVAPERGAVAPAAGLSGTAPVAVPQRDGVDRSLPVAAPALVEGPAPSAERVAVREISREVERAPVIAPVAVVSQREGAVPSGRQERAVPGVPRMDEAVSARASGEVRDAGAAPATARTVMPPEVKRRPAVLVRADVARALPAAPAARGSADGVFSDGPGVRGGVLDGGGPAAAPVAQAERTARDEGAASGLRVTGADRAVAPMRMASGPGGGGGTVMLDGRLVGEWLMDRMARDAGRPAAGMTGFDPRQAPAWTPAGAA